MKKVILVLSVAAVFNRPQTYAQAYHSMLGDSNTWYVDVVSKYVNIVWDANDTLHLSYSSRYYTQGDSIVKGLKYKKFYVEDPFDKYSMTDTGLVGLIREDTVKHQVFFILKDID